MLTAFRLRRLLLLSEARNSDSSRNTSMIEFIHWARARLNLVQRILIERRFSRGWRWGRTWWKKYYRVKYVVLYNFLSTWIFLFQNCDHFMFSLPQYVRRLLTDTNYFWHLAILVICGDVVLTELIVRFISCQTSPNLLATA